MKFDKFAWLKAVYADPRFPPGEKAVLAYVSVFSVLHGESSFRVRQATVADAAHSGISRQTVGSAIRRAKRHGYLAVVSPHAPGRTRHTAEKLQLFLPAKSKEALHDSRKQPARPAKSTDALRDSEAAESGKANGANGVKQTAESCKAANPSASENGTPTSSSTSSLSPGTENENPRTTTEEQLHAPNGASLDEKKPRPQFAGKFHRVLKSTNISQAGRPASPKQNDNVGDNGVVREGRENQLFQVRLAGISECDACDKDGYLPDDTQCWHGKDQPA